MLWAKYDKNWLMHVETAVERKRLAFFCGFQCMTTLCFVDFAVHQFYFSSHFGAELSAGFHCMSGRRMDYLCVIPRSNLIDDDYNLLLRIKTAKFSSKGIIINADNCFKSTGVRV